MSDPRSENSNPPMVPTGSGPDEFSDESLQSIHAQLLREKPEPEEGFSPIPIFLLLVFSGLIFFGGIYMAKYSAGFSPLAFNELAHPGEGTEPRLPPDP